jgi:hypothetical protein
MQNFVSSPGITPLITDLVILGLLLSLGLIRITFSSNQDSALTFSFVLGIDTVVISLIKIITDYYDLGDLALSVIALVSAMSVVIFEFRKSARRHFVIPSIVLGLFAILFGVGKILRDFYDPFDLVLACCMVLLGALLIKRKMLLHLPTTSS